MCRCAPGTIYYGNGKCDYGSSNSNNGGSGGGGGGGGGGYNKCKKKKFNQEEGKEFQLYSNF